MEMPTDANQSVCAKAKLVVELDGSQHYEPDAMKKDEERTAFLERFGLTVLRIPNNEVTGNFEGGCRYIDDACSQCVEFESFHR